MSKKDRIYIVPKNDLESVEIISALKKLGYEENVNLFITEQGWGASWKNLEPEIIEAVREKVTPVEATDHHMGHMWGQPYPLKDDCIISLEEFNHPSPGHTYSDETIFAPDGRNVYGVELQGEPLFGANNIDHHYYQNNGKIDDRTQDKSSLEQVMALEGRRLTVDQMFIAANDKSFVDGMIRYGYSLAMPKEELFEKIKEIRQREHAILAEQQGITPEMEKQAEEAIRKATYTKTDCMVVELPHSKCATVTDRIPMQEYEGGLLIVCADGERDYYGPSDKVEELRQTLGGWSGNTDEEFTFWGTSDPVSRERIEEVIDSVSQGGSAAGDCEIEDEEIERPSL